MHTHETQSRSESCVLSFNHLILIIIIIIIIMIIIINSNWTEWSTIQGVIARVVSKSDEREA